MGRGELMEQFDGRGRVELQFYRSQRSRMDTATAVAYELGYQLHEMKVDSRSRRYRLTFLRDDDPLARRRAENSRLHLASATVPRNGWRGNASMRAALSPDALEAGRARSAIKGYEQIAAPASRSFRVIFSLIGFGLMLINGWGMAAGRFTEGSVPLFCIGVLCVIAAVWVPMAGRRHYRENRELLTRSGTQQGSSSDIPPPPPPMPPRGRAVSKWPVPRKNEPVCQRLEVERTPRAPSPQESGRTQQPEQPDREGA